MKVVVEVSADGRCWTLAGGGGVGEDEPLGSLSWVVDGRRDVYLFGFRDRAGVWRSSGGVDVANAAVREVHTTGLVRMSDLAEPYELPVDDRGRRVRMRLIR